MTVWMKFGTPTARRALAVCCVAAVAACGGESDETAPVENPSATAGALPVSVPAATVEGGFLVVTPAEVREWADAGEEFVLVDARDPVQYGQEHIPGAINVPYVDIRAGGALPPRDARVVVYCSDPECPISRYAYSSLQQLGYTNLYDMAAGIQGWKTAGYPTVIGTAPAGEAVAPGGEDGS
ncbi:MAG TPA: rhodanese-like domain-containing protein [Gemmatimonadota bacterium]|nr:rhodanese-like domain-containing protein [Gemmatimonadota bacterium]